MIILKHFDWKQGVVLILLLVVVGWLSDVNAYESITNRAKNVTVDVVSRFNLHPAICKIRGQDDHPFCRLSQDLVAVSTLKDDQGQFISRQTGRVLRRVAIIVSGVLGFPVLKGSPKTVRWLSGDVAGVPERVFEWKIEK